VLSMADLVGSLREHNAMSLDRLLLGRFGTRRGPAAESRGRSQFSARTQPPFAPVLPPRARGDILLTTTPPDGDKPRSAPAGRDRKGGPHDGPPRGARRRAQGEEASRGGRRTPEGGAGPPLGRAEGILAPEPPERGGRREGPAGAGTAYMVLGRTGAGAGPETGKGTSREGAFGAKVRGGD